MHFQTVIESVDRVLCVALLIASVIPVLVMPYRIFQAFADRAKQDRESVGRTYDPIFAWLIYFWECLILIALLRLESCARACWDACSCAAILRSRCIR